ncbi:hypothetical protein LUZ60_007101 [Juncus effusus]|nr:hypothetical protein LUZ60_007101 [Juncus effusus]
MASLSALSLLFLLTATLTCCQLEADSDGTFGVDFHHRFSDKVREWAKSHDVPDTWQADEMIPGTPEYYKALIHNDLHRHHHHGRSLASGDLCSFPEGNGTILYLGHIHYAFVNLGTPNQTFLVALDTGSHLFWVPCNCQSCAPHSSKSYGKIVFSDYKPEESTTSKAISCSSSQCDSRLRRLCTGKTTDCVYQVVYGGVNTSSTGVMLEDVLLLKKENAPTKLVQLPVVFGCGEIQTGDFLNAVAPNGLMGLGYDNLSVPTMIAKNGLITDSFSMCFGLEGIGRLDFGDVGSSSQYETTLLVDNIRPFYNISVTGMTVNTKTYDKVAFNALIDSGTSFPIFEDSIYTQLTSSFDSFIKDERIANSTDQLGFEYCYQPSASASTVLVPGINFTTKGGDPFMVLSPIIPYFDEKKNPVAYCLAVFPGNQNIIGEKFLMGLKLVFNREKLVLGWEPSNCYGTSMLTSPSTPDDSAPPPDSDPTPLPPPISPRKAWASHVRPMTLLDTMTCLFVLACLRVSFH